MAMSREEVYNLMSSSDSEQTWDANCDRVKAAFGGKYPDFWLDDILITGLAQRVLAPRPIPAPGPPDRPSPLSDVGPAFDF